MAKPDVRDDAFIREVDDEYRRSQLAGWWTRYGRTLAVAIVLLLVVLVGVLYWNEYRAKQAGLTGEKFNLALTQVEAGNAVAAAPELAALSASGSIGYKALARLMQAANAVQTGDTAKAVTLYRSVSNDAALPKPYRDLATIKAIRLEYDTLPPATVVERLKTLSVPGDPWFGIAGEMTALADLRLGKPDAATPLLVAIVRDQTVAPSIRSRAAQLAVSLGIDPLTLVPPRALTGNAQ